MVWNRVTIRKFFSSKKQTKSSKDVPVEIKTQVSKATVLKDVLPVPARINYSAGCGNLYEFLNQKGRIEDIAEMEYKKFPTHLKHFNRSSPDYIESEYDDHTLASQIKDYNEIIDNLKTDLLVHRRYQDEVQLLKEQSLDHLQRGNTRNVFDVVQDYSGVPKEHLKSDVDSTEVLFTLLDNLGMAINNTLFNEKWTKLSNQIEREKQLDERPVDSHFNQLKGSKYDVEVPHHLRHKHVADRLGHPEIYPTPVETILRLERFSCHPGFLDQPFIQIPSAEPDGSLDLRPGEILYENPHSREWNNFWICSMISSSVYFFVWMPYLLFVKSTTPSFKVREEVTIPYLDQNFFLFDSGQLGPVLYIATLYFFFHISFVS